MYCSAAATLSIRSAWRMVVVMEEVRVDALRALAGAAMAKS